MYQIHLFCLIPNQNYHLVCLLPACVCRILTPLKCTRDYVNSNDGTVVRLVHQAIPYANQQLLPYRFVCMAGPPFLGGDLYTPVCCITDLAVVVQHYHLAEDAWFPHIFLTQPHALVIYPLQRPGCGWFSNKNIQQRLGFVDTVTLVWYSAFSFIKLVAIYTDPVDGPSNKNLWRCYHVVLGILLV